MTGWSSGKEKWSSGKGKWSSGKDKWATKWPTPPAKWQQQRLEKCEVNDEAETKAVEESQ